MIGNDIVDLNLSRIESNWQRKGFLNKIFTAKEQIFIQNSINQEFTIWNLWTRKEAAYKIYVQETKTTGYFPLKIECDFDNELYGTVTINDKKYHTKTEISVDYIYTVAVKNAVDFEQIIHLESKDNIIKNNGIPRFSDYKNNNFYPVSITNHGRFEKIVKLNNIINLNEI